MVELAQLWEPFLRHLDRVWNKGEAYFSRSPRWQGWKAPYLRARSKDPLITYLVQARNADEHQIEEITEAENSNLTINPAQGQSMKINMTMGRRGEIAHFESDVPARFDFYPGRVKLLPVTNRGQTFQPPTSHLGQPIDVNNLVDIAEKGFRYYENFLTEGERFFFDSSPRGKKQ